MSSQREGRSQINFYASTNEAAILTNYCNRTARNKTDVLRELIRSLEEKL